MAILDEVVLLVDEFEAMRLADYEGLYQEQAAAKMRVSRQTFGRIIESAHKKIAEALIFGKAIKIEGGEYIMSDQRRFKCSYCEHLWELPYGSGRPNECPNCKNKNIHRDIDDRGHSRANNEDSPAQNESAFKDISAEDLRQNDQNMTGDISSLKRGKRRGLCHGQGRINKKNKETQK